MRKVEVEKKRRDIVESAAKVFARHGYHQTTLDQIAEKLGIAKGSLYLYFKDKKSLFDAVCNYTLSMLNAEIKHLSQEKGDLVSVMKKGLKMFFSFCENNRHFVELLVEERALSRRVSKLVSFARNHIKLLERRLEEAMEAGILRKMDVQIAGGVFVGMVIGALFAYFKERIPFTLDKIIEGMLDVYFRGTLVKK